MTRILPLFALLFSSLLAAPRAEAAEEAPVEEPGALERLDAHFGEWFVAPLAGFLFFDIAFWDDSLPEGEGVGTLVDGEGGLQEEVTAFRDGQYVYQARMHASADALQPDAGPPVEQTDGEVVVTVERVADGLRGEVASQVLALEPCVDFDGCGVPIAEWDGAAADAGSWSIPHDGRTYTLTDELDASAVHVLGARASFAVPVVAEPGGGLRVLAGSVALPAPVHRPEVGDTVRLHGAPAEVLAFAEGQATLRMHAERLDPDPLPNPDGLVLPLVVVWLVLGALFFTLRMQFINIRAFWHAIQVTRGVYDDHDDPGEISHFQALASALSATVGLGNIAGVAIAVGVGGPGAVFWMVVAGFLGMSSKFTECTLGQMYRQVDAEGRVSGGPMRYLQLGLADLGWAPLGRVLAVIFAVMCIGGSLGGGNMFQANQSYNQVAGLVPILADNPWLYGLLLATAVGLVILGGIRRIGSAAGVIVPVMCGVYIVAGVWILLVNAENVPWAFSHIVSEAFSPEAGVGGMLGVLIQGFRRAAFSNEAGIGSASIAHSAASTDEPVREGIVALLEPFIDTIIVCTMTGLVVVVTGTYRSDDLEGVLMTSRAFESVLPWFPMVLSMAVVLFAFSTMISWSYYGERCVTYLFGERASLPYKVIFLVFVFLGSVFKLGNVLDFSDLMVLGMAFPNILGLLLLSSRVRLRLDEYWGRYRSGEMQPRSSEG